MFDFDSPADGEIYRSFAGLIKYNNGQFKSVKQSIYLCKTLQQRREGDTPEFAMSNFGVPLEDNQFMVFIRAYVRWVDYGANSYRPVGWIFVLDTQGVVAKYKLGWQGTMRSGTSVDASKTKCEWQRQEIVTPLVFEEVKKDLPESTSEHLGTIGDRIEFTGKIVSVTQFEKQKFHYYDHTIGQITRLDVEGNIVVYFGFLGERGETVAVKATVKKHDVYNGRKQTVISRSKIQNVASAIAA